MVWPAISYFEASELVIVKENMKSKTYCKVLDQSILLFAAEVLGENRVFQQDNTPIYVSHLTKRWFKDKGVRLLPWPAKSLDLNIIQCMSGILAREVYKNGKPYESVKELEPAKLHSWNSVSEGQIKTLYKSMPGRLADMLGI